MLLSSCLLISVEWRPPLRRGLLLIMAVVHFRPHEFLAPFSYMAGAILAELAQMDTKTLPQPRQKWMSLINGYWSITLFWISAFFATQPPVHQHRATYSRVIYNFVEKYLTPEYGIVLRRSNWANVENLPRTSQARFLPSVASSQSFILPV